MGVLPASQRDVVIVVDSSAALSGLFPTILKDYLQPCLEHFCGGGIADSSTGLQYGPVQYSLVVVHPPSISYRPPCTFYPVTCSAPQIMKWLGNIKFEGGLVEQNFHLSEALAAVLEVFTLMESTVDPFLSPDADVLKQCLLVMGFPPSRNACVESADFVGKDTEQLIKLIVQRNISISIVSPRRLPPFLSLFEKALLAIPTSGSPEKKAESEERGADGATDGSGEPTTVAGVIEKADHSLQKDHLVLLQGFEIQALKSQRKAKEPASSTQQLAPPSTVGAAAPPSDQQQTMDVKPSLAEFKPPSVASLGSIGIDQSNPPSVLSTTSSSDAVAMEIGGQPPLSVKQEFMETSSTSIAMVTAGGGGGTQLSTSSANLDSKLAPTMEGGSMLGLKRSASPQTSGPGSVGPPSTKSIKLEDDTSATSSLTASISQTSIQQQALATSTSQPQQQFSAGQNLPGTAGLSFSGPPISLSTTATAQVIASSIGGGGNPSVGGGVTMTTQGGGVVGRILGNIPTAAGSAGNPIQIGSPVTGPSMTFPTSLTQQTLASSASSTLPSSSIASGLFSTNQQSQMQVGGASSQLGQLQTTAGNLPASSIQQQQQQQHQVLASSIAQNNPVASSLANPMASMGNLQQQGGGGGGGGGVSSLYGTTPTGPKVALMTSSYQQGIPQQQQQQQQTMASMANTSVNMQQQQQPGAQFSQPGVQQTQRQTNLDAARKFAEMAKQQAELQKSGQGVQPRTGPIGLQQPGSRPVMPGMANVGMQQQQPQQQNVGGMGMGQGQGGMGMGQNQPGMNMLPGQQPQQQQPQQMVNVASSSVVSMQQGGGGVTVTAFGGQRVPTPPIASQQQQQPAQPQQPSQQQQQQQQLLSQQQQQQLHNQQMTGPSQQISQQQQQQTVQSVQQQQAQAQAQVQQAQQQQQQARPMVVWSGIMELTEVQDNKRQMRQVQCNVLTAKTDVVRELQPNQWPQRMNMNTYPKLLFNSITQMMNFQSGANNVKTVTFQFLENPQNVTMLRMLMTSEVKTFAIVQLVGVQQSSQCPIRALILVWNDRQKQFTGLVPLEQDKFITVLRQVLSNAQRQRIMLQQQQQQQAQQAQQAQQGQQTGMQQQMSYQQQQQPGQAGVSSGQPLQAHQQPQQQQQQPQPPPQQQQQGGMGIPGQQGATTTTSGVGGAMGGAPGQVMTQQQQQQQQAQAINRPQGMVGMSQLQQLQQTQQQQQMAGQGMAGGGGATTAQQMNQGPQQIHGQMTQQQQQQQQQGQMMQQGQQNPVGGMMAQPPQGGQQQQIDVKMAQIQQFIRSLATASPQQQEQLLQRVPLQKRAQVLMRAQQIRQQMQQQQQQQQGYNPGGGGMMGTGGIQPNLPQSSQPGMNMTGQIPTAVSGMQQQQQQRPPGMGGMQMGPGMMNVPRPGMAPQQQMPPGSGGYWQTQ